MADNKASGAAGNTALDAPHDKVAMLSLKADGVPRDHNPEIIGDKDAALAAAKEQFRQQAVSAVDRRERAAADADEVDQTVQDPFIAGLKDKHDSAAEAAEKAAEATVNALHTDDPDLQGAPAGGSPVSKSTSTGTSTGAGSGAGKA